MIVAAEPLEVLRTRTSEKWTMYPPEVLPLFVAEMDYPLARPIVDTIVERVRAFDTGYAGPRDALVTAFERFAWTRWGWGFPLEYLRTTTDVSVGIVETLRQAIRPGDGVIITPPIYPPFFDLVPEAGGVVVEVPLTIDGLDIPGLERAFRAGAKAVLLSNPHNPLGLVHSASSLLELAELADRFGVVVVSDEIHAPLVHAAGRFTPYLDVSHHARNTGITVTSASKAFNIAGTKCALMIASSERMFTLLERMPEEVGFRTSQLGLHANTAAFGQCDEWLDGAIAAIAASGALLRDLLDEHLPGVGYTPPQASYLAWLDFRSLGWGDDPSIRALAAGVAINAGPTFGTQGRGFARLNLACSPEVLTEAVRRLGAAA